MFSFTGNPCHFRKLFIRSTLAILSSMPINSDYVELCGFTFFLVEILIISPFPIVNTTPVLLFMLACTDNATSMHHVKFFVSSAYNFSTSFIVSFNNLITRNNFVQSLSFVSLAHEDRNEIS